MKKNLITRISEKNYDSSDYKSSSEFESGLAITHEQATDSLTEGTIEAKIDHVNGKDVEIPRKGYAD